MALTLIFGIIHFPTGIIYQIVFHSQLYTGSILDLLLNSWITPFVISLRAKQQRLYQRLYADEIGAQNNNKEVYDSK